MRLPTLALVLLTVPVLASGQRRCRESSTPEPLPMAMQLVDSTALAAAIGTLTVPPTTYSLWYADGGQLTHVLALADSLVVRHQASADSGSMARAQLATVISGAAFPLDSGRSATLRLTVARESGGALTLSVARSVGCAPELLSQGDHLGQATTTTRVVGVPANGAAPHGGVVIDDVPQGGSAVVTIDAAGRTRDVRITTSAGNGASDTAFRQWLESRLYAPALVDGFPRATEIQIQKQMLLRIEH